LLPEAFEQQMMSATHWMPIGSCKKRQQPYLTFSETIQIVTQTM